MVHWYIDSFVEMDALFAAAPLFVPGTTYAARGDRFAAEDELRKGTDIMHIYLSAYLYIVTRHICPWSAHRKECRFNRERRLPRLGEKCGIYE